MPSATLTVSQRALADAQAAQAAGFRGDALVTAVAVAGAESGFGANLISATGDYGDWQINHQAHPSYDVNQLLGDRLYNARAAFEISSGGANWSPWTTYTSGAFRQHLAEAQAAVAQLASSVAGAARTLAAYVFPLPQGSYSLTQKFTAGGHPGADLAAPAGTPIYAVVAGKIRSVGGDPNGFGNDYPVELVADGTTITYGHAMKSFVQPGQSVVAGQIIGLVGSEGLSTGNHLHLQVNLPNGQLTDPLAWLTARGATFSGQGAAGGATPDSSSSNSATAELAGWNPLGGIGDALKSFAANLFFILIKVSTVAAGGALVVLGIASTANKSVPIPPIIPV